MARLLNCNVYVYDRVLTHESSEAVVSGTTDYGLYGELCGVY
jgi:hypothetical protein